MRIRRDTILRRLIEARDLISDPNRWVKGCAAVDADGIGVDALDKSAVQFCAVGAIDRVCNKKNKKTINGDEHYHQIVHLLNMECIRSEKGSWMVDLNDSPSPHARRSVLGCFNRVIKQLESELAEARS
jgi:hypothetical protein